MGKSYEKTISKIWDEVLPETNKEEFMEDYVSKFIFKLKERIKKLNLEVEVHVGGSYAKGTLIKKEYYDIDLFLRFSKKYPQSKYNSLTKKILRPFKNKKIVHGSRDYFRLKVNSWLFLEIVPVKKISNYKEAENVTDLSYFHVKYLKNKISSEKIRKEIKLAKSFCYATRTYGAESYIKGFSGYSLELMIYHYGSFLNFLKNLVKSEEKLIIDIEKHYKNKNEILVELNGAKLESPIILIDPTFKERNASASLSYETFKVFKTKAKDFLKNPSEKFFKIEKINYPKLKESSRQKNFEFILIQTKTKKQRGDVAGSKLLKFKNTLHKEFERYFEIKDSGFEYLENKKALNYFIVKKKKELIFEGPFLKDKNNVELFKKEHKNTFINKEKILAKEKINFTTKEFLKDWKKNNARKIKQMYISRMKILD